MGLTGKTGPTGSGGVGSGKDEMTTRGGDLPTSVAIVASVGVVEMNTYAGVHLLLVEVEKRTVSLDVDLQLKSFPKRGLCLLCFRVLNETENYKNVLFSSSSQEDMENPPPTPTRIKPKHEKERKGRLHLLRFCF